MGKEDVTVLEWGNGDKEWKGNGKGGEKNEKNGRRKREIEAERERKATGQEGKEIG